MGIEIRNLILAALALIPSSSLNGLVLSVSVKAGATFQRWLSFETRANAVTEK